MANETTSHNIVLEFTKALIWPLMTLLLVLIFWTPLHQIVVILPALLEKSETITLGSLKIGIRGALSDKITPDLKEILAQLDENDVTAILSSDPDSTMLFSSDDGTPSPSDSAGAQRVASWRHLAKIGLVREMTGSELKDQKSSDGSKYYAGFVESEKFGRTRDLLIGLTAELIKEPKAVSVKEEPAKSNKQ